MNAAIFSLPLFRDFQLGKLKPNYGSMDQHLIKEKKFIEYCGPFFTLISQSLTLSFFTPKSAPLGRIEADQFHSRILSRSVE